MIHIDLYNRNFDYVLLSKNEVFNITKKNGEKFFPVSTKDNIVLEYDIDNINIIQYFHKNLPVPNKDRILVYCFYDGNATIIDKLFEQYSNNMDYKIVIVTLSHAESWLFSYDETLEAEYKKKFLDSKNFYLIHFQSFFKQERCFFLRKIELQNLLNFVPSVSVYYHMYPYFKSIKKNYRIGFHINRLNQYDRIYWLSKILNGGFHKNNKMFLTITKYQRDLNLEQIAEQITELDIKEMFDMTSPGVGGIHTFSSFYNEDWYLPNLFDLSLKSDIEIVYETNAFNTDVNKHLTEKTLKHLMLGKPFICTEPTTYRLIEMYGFKNYDGLYSEDLKELYNSYTISENKNYYPAVILHWKNIVEENIKRLIEMNEIEWKNLMIESAEIADYNHKVMTDILFNENIKHIIKKISYE